MAAGFFQLAGHVDIIFFIETSLDFHEDRDLFAVFGGLGQGGDDGRLAADAVERLFDGQDMGVRRSQLDEVFYRFKGFIGMMDHDVPFGNGRPEIRRVDGGQFRRRLRRHRRIAQVIVAVDADEGEEDLAVQGTRNRIDVPFFELQFIAQEVADHARRRSSQFQAPLCGVSSGSFRLPSGGLRHRRRYPGRRRG